MPRALVTGATGLVGSHLVERLRTAQWQTRALVRAHSGDTAVARREEWLRSHDVEPCHGDILDESSFVSAAAGCDVIFHTAAVITVAGSWEDYRRVNIDGTRNAVAAAQHSGARLLQLSSVAVYGTAARYATARRVDEDTPLAALPERAYYARSKRESEAIVFDAHRDGRIWASAVRPSVIYGRRDRQFVPRIARLLRFGFAPAVAGGRSTMAIVHAANVADGAFLAATSDGAVGRAYNLANDFDVTVAHFLRLAAEGLGVRVRLIPVPFWLARALFRGVRIAAKAATGGRFSIVSNSSLGFVTKDNPFTSERAKRELGWVPAVRPDKGIPDAFRSWRQQQSAK